MIATIPIENVATRQDLIDELGSLETLENLLSATKTAEQAMQLTLNDVVDNLRNRVPPINERDLVDVGELRTAVVLGTLARLYLSNVTVGNRDDVNANKNRIFQTRYENRLAGLRPTVTFQGAGPTQSIAFSRR